MEMIKGKEYNQGSTKGMPLSLYGVTVHGIVTGFNNTIISIRHREGSAVLMEKKGC